MKRPLKLAVAQPRSLLSDLVGNVERHADAVRVAEAQVVVFPELSLTGYGIDVEPVDADGEALQPLIDVCRATDTVALVGAPTPADGGGTHISMLRVDGARATVAYHKMFLGGQEPRHFVAGSEPCVVDVDGWRLGLAVCKDTGVAEQADRTAVLGIDVYVAGVCESEDDRHVQPERAARMISDLGVWVAYASFAGPTGGGFDHTAGRSAIWRPDGGLALELGRQPGEVGAVTLNG